MPCSKHQQGEMDFFRYWVSNEFPLIFTRQFSETSKTNIIRLGLPYFDVKTNTKYRYSFSINIQDIKSTSTLPDLQNIFPSQKNRLLFDVGVYGSYAWQYLTEINYVQRTSDLDILITYNNQTFENLITQLNLISQIEDINQLDGEIRLPKFGDCQLQEFVNIDANELLFKNSSDVVLINRDTINAEYPNLAIK